MAATCPADIFPGMKVLVVDDDPVIRTVVSAGLKALAHEVTACDNGSKAWELLRKDHFPVLITDWAMPDMNGIQLTQAVRALPREPGPMRFS